VKAGEGVVQRIIKYPVVRLPSDARNAPNTNMAILVCSGIAMRVKLIHDKVRYY